MSFLSLTILLYFASVARAHFRLLFPEPRGVFVADQEPNYCGALIYSYESKDGPKVDVRWIHGCGSQPNRLSALWWLF